jgi:hypothetical protein
VREGLGRTRDPLAHLPHRCADLVRGAGTLFGEAPYLLGNDREPLAMLTRARRFDRGVEREQIGLTRDTLNQLDESADFRESAFELVHLALRGVDDRTCTFEHFHCLCDSGARAT